MMRSPFLFVWLVCALGGVQTSLSAAPKDSVGLVQSKVQLYIIHKVSKGETLSSLSRRYGCSIEDIRLVNKNINTVKTGQKLKIPVQAKQNPVSKTKPDTIVITIDESHANADSKENWGAKKYTVQPGDNLNKIAIKYKVTASQIAKWNGLQNSNIKVGQELIVSGSTTIKPYEKWNQPNSLTAKSTKPDKITSSETNQIEESGWVQLTSVSTHPLLPPGSIVLCTNPDSQKQVLITIEQQQPLNGEYVIGLCEKTLEQLGMQNGPNRVIIKYYQPL